MFSSPICRTNDLQVVDFERSDAMKSTAALPKLARRSSASRNGNAVKHFFMENTLAAEVVKLLTARPGFRVRLRNLFTT